MRVVPTDRLLVVLAVVLLSCGLVPALYPSGALYAIAAAVVCILILLADAFLSRFRLQGVRLRMPAVLRLVKDRSSSFHVEVERDGAVPEDLRIGIAFPTAVGADEESRTSLSAGSTRFKVPWNASPTQRGQYKIPKGVVETTSAAGLWALRQDKPLHSEVRVYPNLLADKKTAAPLLLTRGKGARPYRQIGKGREFEKLREYIAGDTFNDIHWRATARHGRPVTKVFQVERTQEVYAVLDCSRLSGRRIDNEPALERSLTAALLLGLGVQNDGDLFGVIAFDDKVQTIIRAGAGRVHFGACRDALFAVRPKRVAPDYGELSRFLRTRLRKRSLLMILTDLDDVAVAEEFERNMAVVRRSHLVIATMLQPAGAVPVFHGAPVASSDDLYDRLAGHLRWHTLEQTRRRLTTQGINVTLLRPENAAADLVSKYRQVKGRQLL